MGSQRTQQGRPMRFQAAGERWSAFYAGSASNLIAVRSVLRGLPLFFSARPKTPLRVLCIMAFDTLHMLRHAKPLPMPKLKMLAAFLDFAACANAAFDNKDCCRQECRLTLELLEEAGIRSSAVEYLRRLRDLESRRPLPGSGDWQFQKVILYRESVVRLSLAMVATAANCAQGLDEGIRATYCDAGLNILFRIVMQCQIIDDVLDCSKDRFAGLPGFMTALRSLRQVFELTRLMAIGYADDRDLPRTGDLLPLRSALFLVSSCTKLIVILGRWTQRNHLGRQFTPSARGPRLLAANGVDTPRAM
jgi:hypothetical protein